MSTGLHAGMALLIEHEGSTWRTQVANAADPLLVFLGDLIPEELAGLPTGTRLACRFHLPMGIVRFESSVLGRQRDGGRECLRLAPPERVAQEQRRQHLRVSRKLPLHLRLSLKNEALSRAKGRDFLYDCWIEAVALNISAGGLSALLHLPRGHAVAPHKQALVRFELSERGFKDKALTFVRRDWNQDETILVYQFASLVPEETDWIERHNLRWMQRLPGAETPENA